MDKNTTPVNGSTIANPRTEAVRIVDGITDNLKAGVLYYTLEGHKPLTTLDSILEESRHNDGWFCMSLNPSVVKAFDAR